MATLTEREPAVVTGSLMALFAALMTCLHAFRWTDWSPEQSGSVAAVAAIVLPVIQGIITRRLVRPAKLSAPAPAGPPPVMPPPL